MRTDYDPQDACSACGALDCECYRHESRLHPLDIVEIFEQLSSRQSYDDAMAHAALRRYGYER